jgi:phasin family protein
MRNQMQDYMNEHMQAFAGQAQRFGADPLAAIRDGMAQSVSSLKSVRQPMRSAARSGAKLSALTHETVQQLIELQSQMITAALTEMAEGLERASQAKDFAALVGVQADTLRQSAERLVGDANRALEILTSAGRGVQTVAVEAYEKVAKAAEQPLPEAAAKPRRSRQAKAKAKAKTRARAKSKTATA